MRWPRYTHLVLLGALCAAAAIVNGCSLETRHKIMAEVFPSMPPAGHKQPPKPFVRPPRRPPPFKPPPPLLIPVKPYEPDFQTDWKALLRKLPKDAAGGIDWVTALEKGEIKPKAGIDPAAKMQPVLPMDVHLKPANLPLYEVTFPHKPHTEWLACSNCHPRIFHMMAGADPITMGKIFAGQYCGQCHGKVAFAVPTGCPRCHRALAGPK